MKKLSPNGQKKFSSDPSKKKEKLRFSHRVFVVFFHPGALVTAMGGAERRFVEIMKKFCREDDLEITVLESAPSLLASPEITCKNYLLSLSFRGKGWLSVYLGWILWIIRACLKSFSIFSSVKPNVIFVPNNTLPNLISGYVLGFIFQLPICVVVHHIDTPFCKGGLKDSSLYSSYCNMKYSKLVSLAKTFAFYITLPLLKRPEAIIAVSNFTAKTLKVHGVSGSKVFVSGNAIDLDFISKVKPHVDEKVFDGVFVGRIAKEKGIFDLLKVWKKVVKVRKNAKLLIIGSGLELPFLKEKIVVSGLAGKVLVRGRCNDRELYSLLRSSKVFVFPSLFEGWGVAVAEALACGLPVVAYDIPALREVFGELESVYLVPVKDIGRMVSTVLRILELGENEWSRFSRFSKSFARRFRWEKVAKKDLRVLKRVFLG